MCAAARVPARRLPSAVNSVKPTMSVKTIAPQTSAAVFVAAGERPSAGAISARGDLDLAAHRSHVDVHVVALFVVSTHLSQPAEADVRAHAGRQPHLDRSRHGAHPHRTACTRLHVDLPADGADVDDAARFDANAAGHRRDLDVTRLADDDLAALVRHAAHPRALPDLDTARHRAKVGAVDSLDLDRSARRRDPNRAERADELDVPRDRADHHVRAQRDHDPH